MLGVPAVRGDAFGATRIGREDRQQPAMEQLVALTAQARLGRGVGGAPPQALALAKAAPRAAPAVDA